MERSRHMERYCTACAFLSLIVLYGLYTCSFDIPYVLYGIRLIVTSPDILINDYMNIAGPGPALVNAGLVGMCVMGLMYRSGIALTGPSMAALFTVTGFGLFGKNLYNIWPVIAGVYLYGQYRGIRFRDHIIIAAFGTALAPLVSELSFGFIGQNLGFAPWGFIAGSAGGVVAGFFLPPLAKNMLSVHSGYNLYNMGFTCGFVGLAASSILRAMGFELQGEGRWETETSYLAVPVIIFFASMSVCGVLLSKDFKVNIAHIYRSTGRLVSDFISTLDFGTAFFNMGSLGMMGIAYIAVVGGDINGPTIGALLTMAGFGAFGAHPRNVAPVMVGVGIAAYLSVWPIDSPNVVLGALFCSTLAPIAGAFGIMSGVAAGFLHLAIVMSVGTVHGGLNLYNNGFSGGIVAMLLLPILETITKEDD